MTPRAAAGDGPHAMGPTFTPTPKAAPALRDRAAAPASGGGAGPALPNRLPTGAT